MLENVSAPRALLSRGEDTRLQIKKPIPPRPARRPPGPEISPATRRATRRRAWRTRSNPSLPAPRPSMMTGAGARC